MSDDGGSTSGTSGTGGRMTKSRASTGTAATSKEATTDTEADTTVRDEVRPDRGAGLAALDAAAPEVQAVVRSALARTEELALEVERLRSIVVRERRYTADLAAAARAALAAIADREGDPAWYLRDELDAQHRRRA